MKLCIPVLENAGLNAAVQAHFPQADLLLVFDTETRAHHLIDVNASEDLSSEQTVIDAVLCGSINRHTLRSLIDQGIDVYGSAAATVAEAIAQFENGELEAVAIAGRHGQCGCGGHDAERARAGDECCRERDGDEHECCGGHGEGECCGGGEGCGCYGDSR